MLTSLIGSANGFLWGIPMLVVIFGGGIAFTILTKGVQFRRFVHMWKRIMDSGESESGVSSFASFCTTMAMRIGTGNVAGVAVALFTGGPGAIFWMFIAGMTNSVVCFAECVQSSLYKTKIDGEYRGGGYYAIERGLGWKAYGAFVAIISLVGIGAFMPAAATYTICEAFNKATGIPMVAISAVIAIVMFITCLGGLKRISSVASAVVPFMTVIYLAVTIIVTVMNIAELPAAIGLVVKCAFSKEALMGGGFGIALQQGVKRGTFSSASGMGEASPTAAAAETSHPVKVGLANAAGVWLDTCIVCTCSAVLCMMTDCYNTAFGYVGAGHPGMGELTGGGVIFVQYACSTVLGSFAELFIAVMLYLFSFTCLISYYYEAETASTYLFSKPEQAAARKTVKRLLQIGMPILIFIFGIVPASLAWDLSDLALGSITFFNMFGVFLLFPKVTAMLKDYEDQMKAGKDPYYNPDKLSWPGVDVEMWKEVNKKYIEAEKAGKPIMNGK